MRKPEEPVTVLMAESGRAVGGAERVVWELATRLPSSRFVVRVWLSPDPGVDELAAGLAARGIAVERVAEVVSRRDWRGMLATWRRLRALAPRLLHIHHVRPGADRYLAAIAGLARVPHVVITEHAVSATPDPRARRLKRRELEEASAVTTVCAAVADALVAGCGVDRALMRVVANGADPPDAAAEAPAARALRQALGARTDRPLWVMAARLETRKGHEVLLEALASLRARGVDFVAALAGSGSLEDALRRRVHDLALMDHVHFLGTLDEVGPLLAAGDAVVLPSLEESLPLTLLEAMVRARPVVASAVGGIPEVVEDGVSGLLVPSGRPDALATALDRLRRHPRDAEALGLAAAARVRDDFTWARVVERFEAVYDDVLGLASFAPPGPRAGAPA
jgi:glycosyltransferase involved in cell wall biosynthesis